MAARGQPRAVDIDLTVTVEGRECAVWNEGGVVVLNAPTLATVRSLLAGLETPPLSQTWLVARLVETDLTVELRVRHTPVARLGAGVDPSRLAELAGYGADVSLRGIAVAAWRRLL